jgi:hypothetical protein
MPTLTIDRDVLVREIDDLIAVNKDADAKGKALELAVQTRDAVKAQGEASVLAAQQTALKNDADAEAARTAAEVASKVADELVTRQVNHLKALIDGHADDADPTPNEVPGPVSNDPPG